MTTVNSSASEWRNRQWTDEESTSAILKRDTGVEVHGNDKTLRDTKTEQREHIGIAGGVELGVTGMKGFEIAEAGMPAIAEAGFGVLLPVAGFGLGLYGLQEAHEHADEQNAAIVKDQAHVALVGALDLPANCKDQAFGDRSETPRGSSSKAFKMTERIMQDKAGLATLQAHCDRGVLSAYASGVTDRKQLLDNVQKHDVRSGQTSVHIGG